MPRSLVRNWRRRWRDQPWYFCLNQEAVPRYWEFAAVAVLSAREKTTLTPICLYDGAPDPFTDWLAAMGVRVIHHRVGFWRDIERALASPTRKRNWDLANARGCFLRCEICLIEERPIAFYADVDVIFLEDIPYPDAVGGDFAACGEADWKAFRRGEMAIQPNYCNTGVMFIDTARYRAALPGFLEFCNARNFDFFAYDQGAMNNFFVDRWRRLPDRMNWRPFLGPPAAAPAILHFHGPKPDDIRAMARGEKHEFGEWVARHQSLYDGAMALFESYRRRPEVERLARALGF